MAKRSFTGNMINKLNNQQNHLHYAAARETRGGGESLRIFGKQMTTPAKVNFWTRLTLGLVLYLSIATPIGTKSMGSLDRLTEEKVVPDVIDEKPTASIQVKWPSGFTAQQGNELTPTQVKEQPEFTYEAKDDKLYTLAMVDPDAPSRTSPDLREILHFMVANIPGKDVGNGNVFAEYIGSGAPNGTGLHRYVFLLYEQKERLKSDLMSIRKTSRQGRVKFSIRNFAKEHNLGSPVAANFFQAQYDDYVPLLHAQLSSG